MNKFSPQRAASGRNVYFVTSATFARRPLFQTYRVARFFLETLFQYRDQGKYRLYEFVVMQDHFHLLVTPSPQVGLERVVQLIRGAFAYRLRKELELNLEVWERDFSAHWVRDESDYERLAAYIWQKPVRAGLASDAECYPYGSVCGDFEMDRSPCEVDLAALLQA